MRIRRGQGGQAKQGGKGRQQIQGGQEGGQGGRKGQEGGSDEDHKEDIRPLPTITMSIENLFWGLYKT